MITPAQFDDWLRRYGRAWIDGDPQAIVAIFAPDAEYHEVPFAPPMVGAAVIRHYWTVGAKDGQRDVTFDATPIALDGERGYAHWRASFTRVATGAFVELDGVLAARFDDTGRCREFREWWHRRETAAAALRAPSEREE
jgi:ketosteroid isomerase-like protein